MAEFKLDERLRLFIELAFTADRADPLMSHQQEIEARKFGLSGAEIDAARRGRSFDRRTCVALALAMTQEATDRDRKRSEATKAGIPLSVAGQIERYALRMRTTLQQPILPQTISPSQGKRA